ncbi:retrovirus-related pol polyprotein from transposon TNT 1-94 [Tanacetum coccineum]
MTTLAKHITVAGAENHPPMLEKPILKKYSELTKAQQLQDDCDVQATNIILHGLPPDVYALVNHQEAAKDICDRVKMLMKYTELSYQERECGLYNLFDKFAHADSNKPLLTSTGVKTTTSASGSMPSGNTKNNRITRTQRSIYDNNAIVKHSVRNAKFESICAIFNKCLFDANHDMYLVDFVNDVNWKPTGRFFTIVGNLCPLTRITPKKIVHLKETTPKSAETPKPEIKVYSRRPKQIKSVGCPDRSLISGLRMFKTYDREPLSAHELRKSKKSSHQPKAEDTNQEKLYLLHMDLCTPMRVESINGKKYILVIVDDYSRFTWVKFLRSKDEALDAIIKCIKNTQVRLNATVRNVGTDNGTEFVNQTIHDFYENIVISHQTSVARTPQQNGVVERRNRTLVEAARTMLILLCFYGPKQSTQLVTPKTVLRYNKTPYELMHDKKLDLSFFHVFGSLCYPTNDIEDLGKLNAKADIAMASEQFGSGLGLQVLTPATSSSGLVPNLIPQQPCNLPKRDDWDTLFQPLFDEYFNPPTIAVSTVPVAAAPRAVEIADSPVSTSIDQDAPSSSIPSTQDQEHSLIISQGVEESPKTPLFHDDPLHDPLNEDSM